MSRQTSSSSSSSQQGKNKNKNKNRRGYRMPVMLQTAAIEGNRDELLTLLQLQQLQNHSALITDHTDPTNNRTAAETKICEKLQSVTHFGETVLHILVNKGHNELATMVLQKNIPLLTARNKKHETPLHYAAKVGNEEAIIKFNQIPHCNIKDTVRIRNCHGETALHEAVKDGHDRVVDELMQLDEEVAYEVDNKGLSPLHVAIVGGYTDMVVTMLERDARLAKFPDSNGLFPVHVAACMGNAELITHFMHAYPDSAKLVDHHRRNLFHIAAEENKEEVLSEIFKLQKTNPLVCNMVAAMINAKDCDGNTPLHIAAIKGDRFVLKVIWEERNVEEEIRNNKGLTAFDLSEIQVKDTDKDKRQLTLWYIKYKGRCFYPLWFDFVMEPPMPNVPERSQVIGLGSVLVTTAAFTVAFTLPGGLNQNNGIPILGGTYFFNAFIIANMSAFVYAFLSISLLIFSALSGAINATLSIATRLFLGAANCMALSFGLGLYVMLDPVNKFIALYALWSPLVPIGFSFLWNGLYDRRKSAAVSYIYFVMNLLIIFGGAFLSLPFNSTK